MPRISNLIETNLFYFVLIIIFLPDNPVRLIDALVNKLNLEMLGFHTFKTSAPGQKPYSRYDLIKLLLYGYISGICSSRKLASACYDSISLMWLISGATPSKSCICDFVKNNEVPIQNTFKLFVKFLKDADFVDGDVTVDDGTKIRAQNFPQPIPIYHKIDNTIAYFNTQIMHYTSLLKDPDSDSDSDTSDTIAIKEKISGYQKKLINLHL